MCCDHSHQDRYGPFSRIERRSLGLAHNTGSTRSCPMPHLFVRDGNGLANRRAISDRLCLACWGSRNETSSSNLFMFTRFYYAVKSSTGAGFSEGYSLQAFNQSCSSGFSAPIDCNMASTVVQQGLWSALLTEQRQCLFEETI